MIEIKLENIKILHDLDNNKLYYGEKHKENFNKLNPIINELELYLSSCEKYDFDKANNKLIYKKNHAININKIFDKYKKMLNSNEIYLFYYGYWVSDLSNKYFDLYFNDKICKSSYIKNTLFVHKKCSVCHKDSYHNIENRTNFNDIRQGKCSYCRFDISKNPFICYECEEKQYKNKKQIEEYNQNKEITNLKTIPYKDYLKTDHWKQLRKRILKQSGYKCQLCSSKENLNVHHNTYENRGCEKDEDLVVLCGDCHEKFHGIVKANTNEITEPHFISDNTSKTYKIKIFKCDTSSISFWESKINEFISNNITELIDIKTNLFDYTYTMLLIYKG